MASRELFMMSLATRPTKKEGLTTVSLPDKEMRINFYVHANI